LVHCCLVVNNYALQTLNIKRCFELCSTLSKRTFVRGQSPDTINVRINKTTQLVKKTILSWIKWFLVFFFVFFCSGFSGKRVNCRHRQQRQYVNIAIDIPAERTMTSKATPCRKLHAVHNGPRKIDLFA